MPVVSPLGASYGWRARIGLMWPSLASEVIPHEFYMMVPSGVTVCATSLGVRALTHEEYDGAVARIEAPLRELVNRKVDVIVQAGVPPIVVRGWGFEKEVLARIAGITSIPVALDIMCCVEAMQTLQMQRVVLLTPLDDEIQGYLARFVKNAGIDVVASRCVGPFQDYDMSAIPLAVPYRAARDLYRSADRPDGVWITGARMPSVSIIEPLEQDLGVPVVTSSQAMAWTALRLAEVGADVSGFGRLFKAQ